MKISKLAINVCAKLRRDYARIEKRLFMLRPELDSGECLSHFAWGPKMYHHVGSSVYFEPARPERCIVTIASLDQWLATIENHRYRWLTV